MQIEMNERVSVFLLPAVQVNLDKTHHPNVPVVVQKKNAK